MPMLKITSLLILLITIISHLQAQPQQATYLRTETRHEDPITGEAFITIHIALRNPEDAYAWKELECLAIDPHSIYIHAHATRDEKGEWIEKHWVRSGSAWIVLEEGHHRIQNIIPSKLKDKFYMYWVEHEPSLASQDPSYDLRLLAQDMPIETLLKHVAGFYQYLIKAGVNSWNRFVMSKERQNILIKHFFCLSHQTPATGMYAKASMVGRRFYIWLLMFMFPPQQIVSDQLQHVPTPHELKLESRELPKLKPLPCDTVLKTIDPITKLAFIYLNVCEKRPFQIEGLPKGYYDIAHFTPGYWGRGEVKHRYIGYLDAGFSFTGGEWNIRTLVPSSLADECTRYLRSNAQNQWLDNLRQNILVKDDESLFQWNLDNINNWLTKIHAQAQSWFDDSIVYEIYAYYNRLIDRYNNPIVKQLLSLPLHINFEQIIFHQLATKLQTDIRFFNLEQHTPYWPLEGVRGWVMIEYIPHESTSSSSCDMILLRSTRIVWHDEHHPLENLHAGDYTITVLPLVDEAQLGIHGDSWDLQQSLFLD